MKKILDALLFLLQFFLLVFINITSVFNTHDGGDFAGEKDWGEEKQKLPEQLGIIIEKETKITKEVSGKTKKKITTQRIEKSAIHIYRLQGVISAEKFVRIVNEILRRERLLIKWFLPKTLSVL